MPPLFQKNMKKILIAMACFVALSANAQNREIEFKEASWKDQLAMAKKENKLIFFDAYTSWCGPCKMMAKDVFTKDSVADMFNQSFINVKYDMEKGEGVALKDKYEVHAYPTYLFINGDGEVVHKIVGSMSPSDFMKEAGNALNPENTLSALANKFEAGDHSEAAAIAYMEALDKAYDPDKMGDVSKIYFDGLAKPSLMEEHNWNLVLKYLNDPSSQAFAYLYANKAGLEKKYGTDIADQYFQETFQMSVYSIKSAYAAKHELKEAKEKIAAIRKLLAGGNMYSKPILTQLEITEDAGSDQWDKYSAKVDQVWNDPDFARKSSFVIDAANDLVTAAAPAKYYDNALKWATQVEKTNPDLFQKIQIADLRERIFKRQGKTTDAQAMAMQAETLRKEAFQKGQMTPPIYKN